MPTEPAIREVRAGRAWIRGAWGAADAGTSPGSLALAPVAWLYGAVTRVRNVAFDRGWIASRRAPIPVVSVGNLAVGGTGKTPFSAWVAAELALRGHRPAILHGGYADDEPDLHRQWSPETPVIVGRDRLAGTGRAALMGATVAILDDGFQHRRLARDLDIALVAAETWDRPRHLLPRGPWREMPASLVRADIVVVTRKSADSATADRVASALKASSPGGLRCVASLLPEGWLPPANAQATRPDGPCVAVAGIAEPGSFLANARAAGADIEVAMLFGDHHRYTPEDAARIVNEAAGRRIVTTEKDATKLFALLPDADLWALRQEVRIETGAAALAELLDRIGT